MLLKRGYRFILTLQMYNTHTKYIAQVSFLPGINRHVICNIVHPVSILTYILMEKQYNIQYNPCGNSIIHAYFINAQNIKVHKNVEEFGDN